MLLVKGKILISPSRHLLRDFGCSKRPHRCRFISGLCPVVTYVNPDVIKQTFVIEKTLRELPRHISTWIRKSEPMTVEEFAQHADNYFQALPLLADRWDRKITNNAISMTRNQMEHQ